MSALTFLASLWTIKTDHCNHRLLHMQTATQEVRRGLAHVHRLQAPGFAVRV
jgi:hypothetical protein